MFTEGKDFYLYSSKCVLNWMNNEVNAKSLYKEVTVVIEKYGSNYHVDVNRFSPAQTHTIVFLSTRHEGLIA